MSHPHPDKPTVGQGTRKMHRQRGEAQEIRPHRQEPMKRPGSFWPAFAIAVLTIHAGSYTLLDAHVRGGWAMVAWIMAVGSAAIVLVQWVGKLADWARGR